MADVVVVGAGPAGLMAAWTATKGGHRVILLEAADRVGGMAGSFSVGGLRVDFGSHRLHPGAPGATLDLCRDLLGDDLQVRPRNGRIRLAGRWVGFPLRFGELIRALPRPLAARLVADSVVTVGRSGLRAAGFGRSPVTFAEEISARLGPTVNRLFYGPYARKLYGLDGAELDGELARRRVAVSSPIDIATRLLRASRPEGRQFLYPRRGYGQIVEALAERAVAAGVDLRLGVPVEAIRTEATPADTIPAEATPVEATPVEATPVDTIPAEVTRIEGWDSGSGPAAVGPVRLTVGGELLVADVVLSTVPTSTLARLVDPAPPAEVRDALARQRVRAMLLVYLVLDLDQYTPFDAHYLAGPESLVARLSEPKNYRDSDDDPDGRTVLCAEIACWSDDEIVGLDPTEVGKRVAADLERLGLPPVNPVAVETRLLPSVYPVFDRAGRVDRGIIDRWLATPGPVLSLGRQGLGVLDNLHHVLEMGTEAATVIGPGGAIDWPAWQAALQRFADHTVED